MIIDGGGSDYRWVREEISRYLRLTLALSVAVVYSGYRKMKSADRDRKSPTIIIRSSLEPFFERVRGGPDDY